MKIRLIILFISILAAVLILSAGYGLWEERLVIKGYINVVRPEAETLIIPKELPPEEKPVPDHKVDTVTPGGITADYTEENVKSQKSGDSENNSEGSENGTIEGYSADGLYTNGSITGGIDTEGDIAAGNTEDDSGDTYDGQEMNTGSGTYEGEATVE